MSKDHKKLKAQEKEQKKKAKVDQEVAAAAAKEAKLNARRHVKRCCTCDRKFMRSNHWSYTLRSARV